MPGLYSSTSTLVHRSFELDIEHAETAQNYLEIQVFRSLLTNLNRDRGVERREALGIILWALTSNQYHAVPCSTMQYHHPQKNIKTAPDAIRFILHTAWSVGGASPVCSNHSPKGACHPTGRFVHYLQPTTVDTTATSSAHSSFELGSFAHAHPSMVFDNEVAPKSNSILHQA